MKSGTDRGHSRRIPLWVLAVALAAACMHMTPYWLNMSSTPPGWTFTGNTTVSPDLMQYRVWMRQAPAEGVVVSNRFTAEENQAYLPVLFYYGIGKVSGWTGARPESLYAYAGFPLAFALTVLVFVAVRRFLRRTAVVNWVFFVILLGGGLGGYVKFLDELPAQVVPGSLRKLVLRPASIAPLLDDYRQHYVFQVLFDTHFLVIWIAALASVLALHACLRRPSAARAVACLLLFATTTLLHVYSGVTLLAIAASAGLICRASIKSRRERWLGPAAAVVGSLAVLGCLLLLERNSGLPHPTWRELPLPFVVLLLGYPVAALWLLRGLGSYRQQYGLDLAFLTAWVVGCLLIVLAWPFYPYPTRGTMTLQVGLYILAGAVYFGQRRAMTKWEVALIVVLLGATPGWRFFNLWQNHGFSPEAPYIWQSPEHRKIARWLRENGTGKDLLLASPRETLWLAPEFPGRHQVAHFFLTVGYERKLEELEDFFQAEPEDRVQYLAQRNVSLLFVSTHDGSPRFLDVRARQEPGGFKGLRGLRPVVETSTGTLFEFNILEAEPELLQDGRR